MTTGNDKPQGPQDKAAQPQAQGAGAAGEAAQSAGAPEPAASSELAEALREKEQFKKLLQRVQADFINFRNRANDEAEQARRSGARRIAVRVIEVLDLFDAALSPMAVAGVDANWAEGVCAIQRSLVSALAAEGVERLKADGEKFDPRRHEALISTPTAEHAPGAIIRELRPGYTHQGEVIRPAQVEVAVAPPDDQGQPPDDPSPAGRGSG